jgi:hypothetical protein
MERITFGIGCLTFEYRDPTHENEGWKEAVGRALNGLANVRDVSVEANGYLGPYRDEPVGLSDEDAADRRILHPHPISGRVAFTISILTRPQESGRAYRPTGAEEFRVHIHYALRSPVAFVIPIADPDVETQGDSAVIAVRKYLEREIRDETVRFVTIGPSPFHTRGSLAPLEGTQGFGVEVERRIGYDRHNFAYDPTQYRSALEAMDELEDQLVPELSLFYGFVRSRNRRIARSARVARLTGELIAMHTASGLAARVERLFRAGGRARDLTLSVLTAEFRVEEDRADAAAEIDTHYAANALPVFRKEVEAEAADEFHGYLENARRVTELLEQGRSKDFELLVVAASTLLGGIAGAVAVLVAR